MNVATKINKCRHQTKIATSLLGNTRALGAQSSITCAGALTRNLGNDSVSFIQGEVDVVREEKKMLTGQARKLNNELRAALRRREAAAAQQAELDEALNELQLECRAAEGDVR